jgi:hypothetical protein
MVIFLWVVRVALLFALNLFCGAMADAVVAS